MKHRADTATTIIRLAAEMGVTLSLEEAVLLARGIECVQAANRTLNLTRVVETEDAVRLHVVDSLAALEDLNAAGTGVVLDLGTGGGFPGVPLAIASCRRFVLLDSVRKKARAVEDIVSALELSDRVEVRAERAEDHALSHPAEYAVVVARAVAALPCLVELAAPLLCPLGRLVALKGAPESSELEAGRGAGSICGLEERSVRRFKLPGGDEARTIVTYQKVGPAAISLPRRVGLAQKSPLG